MTQLNFDEVLSNQNKGVDQASKTLALVREFPYRTAAELAHKVNPDILTHAAIHKRLPELRRASSVTNPYSRRCTVTRRKASVWVTL